MKKNTALTTSWKTYVLSGFIKSFIALLLASSCSAPPPAADTSASVEKKKPNLLIIYTDEHNFRTLGAYRDAIGKEEAFIWGENTSVPTPNIDRLANEGALCTSFYAASPVCTPSRASFVSGLSACRYILCP